MKPTINSLKEGYGYVIITFFDLSKYVICTTLNPQLLKEANVTCVKDHFYDFLRNSYIPFFEGVKDIDIELENPNVREVDKFANQFI